MDNKKVTMTIKEIKRVEVMKLIEAGKVTGEQAAEMMNISLRQTRRIIKRYQQGGVESLAHGSRGKSSPKRLDPDLVSTIIRLLQESYGDYNNLHLVEVLSDDHGLKVSVSSLDRIRRKAGYPTPYRKKRKKYHTRRARKPMSGQMLQADGSDHDWLEGRGPRMTLIAYIDDATNQVHATFREEEDAFGYLYVLREICLTDGIPQSLYMDKRLSSRKEATSVAKLVTESTLSQFERILEQLGVELITAHSPQAKGRIERLFETFQDRLVKELRRAGTKSLKQANVVLKRFLRKYNQRFTRKAEQTESAFVPWSALHCIDALMVFQYCRTVKNDNTISFNNHVLQLSPSRERSSYAKAKVNLHQSLNGTLTVLYQGVQIASFQHKPNVPIRIGKFIPARDSSIREKIPQPGNDVQPKANSLRKPYSPKSDHPWKRNYGYHLNGKLIQENPSSDLG
jgi:transposase